MNVIKATLHVDESVTQLKASVGEAINIGVRDYEQLSNKPQIEGVTLSGNKRIDEIGIGSVTPQDIDNLLYG